MKKLALLLGLSSCVVSQYPFVTAAVMNTVATTWAAECALTCGTGTERKVADGVTIAELSLASLVAIWAVEFLIVEKAASK